MYGPPSDCKGKANGRSTGLRKCIRPSIGDRLGLLAMMSCAACSSLYPCDLCRVVTGLLKGAAIGHLVQPLNGDPFGSASSGLRRQNQVFPEHPKELKSRLLTQIERILKVNQLERSQRRLSWRH